MVETGCLVRTSETRMVRSSNEDTRKKLKKHIESLKSIVESIESRKDKELPDLKKVLERFTVYAP